LAEKHYNWANGPADLEPHSVTKHDVLVEYLRRYFEQRTLNSPGREEFKITLVDGFCGGGLYKNKMTGQMVFGSPLKMLAAVKEVALKINKVRQKPIEFVIQYIFVDTNSVAINYLRKTLIEQGYESKINYQIHLINSSFAGAFDRITQLIAQHTPKAKTGLFFLDQYGYAEVPATLIRSILTGLTKSEVILTFHVDSFATYADDKLILSTGNRLGFNLPSLLEGRSVESIKDNNPSDWRKIIQHALYQGLVEQCGAKYFTPFFIRGQGAGHGEYWLIHFSQHYRAQDVMKQVHWNHQNHFVHYGSAGMDMLNPAMMGFRQEFHGGFNFDDTARRESDQALHTQLADHLSKIDCPIKFGDLFASTCNLSTGTSSMYKKALANLAQEKFIVITDSEGKSSRTNENRIKDDDILEVSRQLKLF
jgi:three-Cys-motif partner protein